jgi:hypothetical protein
MCYHLDECFFLLVRVLAYYSASTKIGYRRRKKEKEGIVIPYCRFLFCFGFIAVG